MNYEEFAQVAEDKLRIANQRIAELERELESAQVEIALSTMADAVDVGVATNGLSEVYKQRDDLRKAVKQLQSENELYEAEMLEAKEAGFYSAQELFDAYQRQSAELAAIKGQEPLYALPVADKTPEQLGNCCYGGQKPKSACASCGAWKPVADKGAKDAEHCMCPACRTGVIHMSDCAVHNEPAMPRGSCDCGVTMKGEKA